MTAKRPKVRGRNDRSGKPHGKVGNAIEVADLRLLARDAALAALTRLSELARSEDERVALAATQELLNRAFGKASSAGTEDPPATRPLIIKIVRFGESGAPGFVGGRK